MKKYCVIMTVGYLLAVLLGACSAAPSEQETPTLLPVTRTDAPAQEPAQPVSEPTTVSPVEEIDPAARYLFYLHGKIIEDQGLSAVSETFGEYAYEDILETFRGHGFVVRSEQREKDTDPMTYAEKIAGEVYGLLDAGVPAGNITVVGASKGAGIALFVSHLVENSEINYVPMAICYPDVVADRLANGIILHGNVLSIYDAVDDYAGSCEELFTASEAKGLGSHAELVLDVGTGHGILYQPLDEWVLPAVLWAYAPGTVGEVRPEFEKYFEDYPGAFVLYDLKSDHFIRYNPERCAEQFLPASTFKILNSLIGLETGVIADKEHVFAWDGTQYNVPVWHWDHTLETAIRNSVVWYYQELARQVGAEEMRAHLEAVEYGNMDISGEIDTFWLDGALRISPDEQVDFLNRLYHDELPFSQRSLDIVKEIIVMEETEEYRLSGKTGSAIRVEAFQGWFIGILEKGEDVYFFATNFESDDANGFANGENAKRISMDILNELGLLP